MPTPEYPTGRTSWKWYGVGYQAGMDDVIRAYESDGVNGVLQWVEDNTRDKVMLARLDRAVEAVNVARFGH